MSSSIKSARTLGLAGLMAVVAMLVVASVGAASASAKEPTWWYCSPGTAAKEFKDHTCKEELSGGKWIEKELAAGSTLPFASTMAAGSPKKLVGSLLGIAETIECTSETDSGELIGGVPGTAKLGSTEWTGCKGSPCTPSSTIKLEPNLKATLVWRNSTNGEALVRVEGNGAEQKFVTIPFTGLFCPSSATVTGEVLGIAEPSGKMATVGKLEFPCPPVTKYWTGDLPSRAEHTLAKPLALGGEKAEFCETDNVELSGADAGWAFGVFPQGKTL